MPPRKPHQFRLQQEQYRFCRARLKSLASPLGRISLVIPPLVPPWCTSHRAKVCKRCLMDQTIINWLFAALGASLGWITKVVWDAIKELKADMRQIERDLPEVYVRKDDFKIAVADMKSDVRELRQDMKEGFNKIDNTFALLFTKIDRKEDK